MEIIIKRIAKKPGYTIGKLYIDGVFFCNTLEDTDRGLLQTMSNSEIASLKQPGKTAIPKGTYTVSMDVVSPKYSKILLYRTICNGKVPRLLNVPGFNGVLIHIGNKPTDTDGCILVGRNTVVGQVVDSKKTFINLYSKMNAAHKKGEAITLQIG